MPLLEYVDYTFKQGNRTGKNTIYQVKVNKVFCHKLLTLPYFLD